MTADNYLIHATLSCSPLLSKLQPANIEKVARSVRLIWAKAGDVVVEEAMGKGVDKKEFATMLGVSF